MPSNVEIKARVPDLAGLQARAAALSDSPVQVLPQVDTFFTTARGRLKLREVGSGLAQLIYYVRPDQGGPRRSDYSIYETHDPSALKMLLSQALGARGVVEKTRYLYMIGQTRLHLDEVKDLGSFVELEVVLQPGQSEKQGREIARGLMARLEIRESDLLDSAYMDLIEQVR